MKIDRIDHVVLTVQDVEATIVFYVRVLGMQPVTFAGGRRALAFGQQKLNLHAAAAPFDPHAAMPTPGAIDLCFISAVPLAEAIEHLRNCDVAIESGPVRRTGALGPMTSIYFRDPDGNLVEVSRYD